MKLLVTYMFQYIPEKVSQYYYVYSFININIYSFSSEKLSIFKNNSQNKQMPFDLWLFK